MLLREKNFRCSCEKRCFPILHGNYVMHLHTLGEVKLYTLSCTIHFWLILSKIIEIGQNLGKKLLQKVYCHCFNESQCIRLRTDRRLSTLTFIRPQ